MTSGIWTQQATSANTPRLIVRREPGGTAAYPLDRSLKYAGFSLEQCCGTAPRPSDWYVCRISLDTSITIYYVIWCCLSVVSVFILSLNFKVLSTTNNIIYSCNHLNLHYNIRRFAYISQALFSINLIFLIDSATVRLVINYICWFVYYHIYTYRTNQFRLNILSIFQIAFSCIIHTFIMIVY